MPKTMPTITTPTVAVTQSRTDPSSLTIHRLGSMNPSTDDTTAWQTISVRNDLSITTVAVVPHGIAVADDADRINLWQRDLVGTNSEMPVDPGAHEASTSVWIGAPIAAVSWRHPDYVVCGDRIGRLMGLDSLDVHRPPDIIASTDAVWIAIVPLDDESIVAVAADGTWVATDHIGTISSEGMLPLEDCSVTRVQICRSLRLLFYQIAKGRHQHPDTLRTREHLNHEWRGWDLSTHQPVPLPDVVRFAHDLKTNHRFLFAMNRQGHSYRWSPEAIDATHTPASNKSAPLQPLCGWPAGPSREVALLDETPTLVHINPQGEIKALQLRGDIWYPLALNIPNTQVRHLWLAEPGAIERALNACQAQYAHELIDKSLRAHKENQIEDRDRYLDLLEASASPGSPETPGITGSPGSPGLRGFREVLEVTGIHQAPRSPALRRDRKESAKHTPAISPTKIKALTMRARFAADEGDLLAALEHLRRVVVSQGQNAPPTLLNFYGKLLWRSGAVNELSCYEPGQWPSIYTSLQGHLDLDAFSSQRDCLTDAFALDPPSDCPWSTLAWEGVRGWGTASPYWLGAECLAPLSVRPSDQTHLAKSLVSFGAQTTRLSVLAPHGLRPATTGWVFTDPIPKVPMHRQLIAWIEDENAAGLNLRWAVQADREAKHEDWTLAWRAVHDPLWRADLQRRLEIIRHAIACGVVPTLSMTQAQPHAAAPSTSVLPQNGAPTEQEIYR